MMRRISLSGWFGIRRLLNALGLCDRRDGAFVIGLEPSPDLRARTALAAEQAAAYLQTRIRDDGAFVYRITATDGREDVRRYNVLRHAGSVLALAQHARATEIAAGDAARLMGAARFMVDHCIRAPKTYPDLLAVWSDPALTGGRRRRPVAKLGGNGLALAALLELEALRQESPEAALKTVLPREGLQALGEFILLMQRPDGSFQSLYSDLVRPSEKIWVSLYYPGEAALGLIMLFEHDRDLRWLRAAVLALNYLAVSRAGQAPPPDHWALIATARLFECAPEILQESVSDLAPWRSGTDRCGVRDRLIDHAEAVTRTMLDEQCVVQQGRCPAGWFGPEPRIAPTATRLEGLLAASHLPLDVALQRRVAEAVGLGLRFLLDSQLQAGPAAGGFSRTCLSCARADDKRATEVRIDYVQHALAAFRAYLSL